MTALQTVREHGFGARYHQSSLGRFLSPDWSDPEDIPDPVPYANLSDPQSLNLYGYMLNDPVSNADPDGHVCIFGIWACAKKAPPPNCGNPCNVTAPAPSMPLRFKAMLQMMACGAVAFNRLTTTRSLTAAEVRQAQSLPLRVGEITPPGEGLLDVGEEAAAVVERAFSAIGNETITVSSRAAAEKAAAEFVGDDSIEMTQRFGDRAGQQIGRKSADGVRNFRDDGDHFNLVNHATGGSPHVRFLGGQ